MRETIDGKIHFDGEPDLVERFRNCRTYDLAKSVTWWNKIILRIRVRYASYTARFTTSKAS